MNPSTGSEFVVLFGIAAAQELPLVDKVELQPLAAQVNRGWRH